MSTGTFVHTRKNAAIYVNHTNNAMLSIRDGEGNDIDIFFANQGQMIEVANKILEAVKPDSWKETNDIAAQICGIEPSGSADPAAFWPEDRTFQSTE